MNSREAAKKLEAIGFVKHAKSRFDLYVKGDQVVSLNRSDDDDPVTTRKVRTALRRAEQEESKDMKVTAAPDNAVGSAWTDEEDILLMEMFSQFKGDPEIAHVLKRTPKAIEIRRTKWHLKRDLGGRPIGVNKDTPRAEPHYARIGDHSRGRTRGATKASSTHVAAA